MADRRNATASWSGYLHQGQVGILVALREINRLLNAEESLDGWRVIFENAEDFDIQQGQQVFSRHQVKAYKDAKYPNDVKDVLGTQTYVAGKLTTKGFQFRKLQNNALGDVEVGDNDRFLHTITEILGFDLDEENFNQQFRANYVNNPHNIQRYKYSDTTFHCPLVSDTELTLENYCITELGRILSKIGHQDDNNTEYKMRIYHELIYQLDLQIKAKHIGGEHHYPTLQFNDILNWVEVSPNNVAANISSIRKKIASISIEYISDLNYAFGNKAEKEIAKLENVITQIYHLESTELIIFLRDINPNEKNVGNMSSISDVIDVIKKDNFKHVFFSCIYKVTKHSYKVSERGYSVDGGYLLSLIVDDEIFIKSVKKRISENSYLTSAFFDKSYLINKEITEPEKLTKGDTTTSVNWGDIANHDDKFTNSNMRLIKLSDAVIQLDHEEN